MKTRKLGKTGLSISPMGIGCWAIGGQFYMDGKIDGYGQTDDQTSIRAIQTALDLGINFIDTADAYGIGHSEKLIGEAIKGRRDQLVIATKFGFLGNEATKTLQGTCLESGYIKRACEASLKRLGTETIDLYQLHVGDVMISEYYSILDTLETLVKEGKIRSYGWSTNDIGPAKTIATNKNCSAIQHDFNVLNYSDEMLKICEENDLTSINRSPLAMGFLSGKFGRDTVLSNQDVRGAGHVWTGSVFQNGRPTQRVLDKLEAIREILRSDGRTLVQGALAWIWAKSSNTVPIPGFKTPEQVSENIKAMEFGPLNAQQMSEIEKLSSATEN